MKIRYLLYTFLFSTLLLAGVVMIVAVKLRTVDTRVVDAQERQLSTYKLADELRQSSDDLTRFARAYAATGDDRFERYYWRILDIRNGVSTRPEGYGGIYWDLVAAGELPEPPAGRAGASSLESRMVQAGITSDEFAKLKEAQDRSDELVNLERIAINAVKGRFDDGTGSFSRVAAPDRVMAMNLLQRDRYYAAKAKIMKPIGEFISILEGRTQSELSALNRQSRQLLTGVLMTSLVLFCVVATMVWMLQSRLVRRSALLLRTVNKIGAGDLSARSDLSGNDEISVLGTAIDSMAGRLSSAISEALRNAQEVTARDREQEIRSELARASKLTTLGTMAASIAHEVRQPLAAIVANSSAAQRWLSREHPDLEEARASLKNIVADGHRASEVVDSVRAMVEKGTQDKTQCDINQLVLEVLALLRGELKSNNISVESTLSDNVAQISVDRGQLQQVLVNLVMNAVEAMELVHDRPRVLRIRSKNDDGDVVVTIEDSGPGIGADDPDSIFKPFFTTKSHGVGLGLSICRSIVEAHGGRLSAAAAKPHGSVFQVVLPREETLMTCKGPK
jgi:C4-dicarboxylate-specific signal transduction histidine kinase